MVSSNQLGTAALVGKSVTYQASSVDLGADGASSLQVNLAATARVAAVISDSSGRVVRTLDLGSRAAGTFDAAWDGRDQSGNALPAGHYSVALSARAADGSAVTVEARTKGVVQGVSLADGSTGLVVGSSLVDLSDVLQISQP
jgi:flagellar basal-body rod modification protein FlgD